MEAFTAKKLCVTRKNCRAWARSLRCCQSASRPDNMLKIWAMRAGRAAQRSQDTYNGRAEWLRRCREGLHGLADPPSATVDDTRVAEFHSPIERAKVRQSVRSVGGA